MNDYQASQIIKNLAGINSKLEALVQALTASRKALNEPKPENQIGSSGDYPNKNESEK